MALDLESSEECDVGVPDTGRAPRGSEDLPALEGAVRDKTLISNLALASAALRSIATQLGLSGDGLTHRDLLLVILLQKKKTKEA